MKIYKVVFTLRTPGGRSTTITGLYSPDESKKSTQQAMKEEITKYIQSKVDAHPQLSGSWVKLKEFIKADIDFVYNAATDNAE
jgi:hypothetical protein